MTHTNRQIAFCLKPRTNIFWGGRKVTWLECKKFHVYSDAYITHDNREEYMLIERNKPKTFAYHKLTSWGGWKFLLECSSLISFSPTIIFANRRWKTEIFFVHDDSLVMWSKLLPINMLKYFFLCLMHFLSFRTTNFLFFRRSYRTDSPTQIVAAITAARLAWIIQQIDCTSMIRWHCIKRYRVPLTMAKIRAWTKTLVLCRNYLFWKVSGNFDQPNF